MKKSIKLMSSALTLLLITVALAGCGKSANNADQGGKIAGSITISGSTAMQPLVEKAAENFTGKNPDASISVQGGGSGTGLTQVTQGSVDIGNSDVFAEEKLKEDQSKQLVAHKVVIQGFAVVVSEDVTVKNLSKEQISKIFSGAITNWKDVGGTDQAINVVHRPASSGTRSTFIKTVLDNKKEMENDKIGTTQDSNGAVKQSLTSTKGSISYLALSYLNTEDTKGIHPISIDNVAPTKENITTNKYPFTSFGIMYTKGEAKDLSKVFIDYMLGEENKTLIEKLGYYPVSK